MEINYGKIGYEAYILEFAEYVGDALLPPYDELIDPVKTSWNKAAQAVVDTFLENT